MEICMLTTGHSALDSRIYYKEALSLRKKYDHITIIAPHEGDETLENGIRILGVKKSSSLYERFKLADSVIQRALEVEADIYHFHDFEIIYKAMRLKRYLPGCKIIYDVHEHYPDMMRMSKKVPSAIKPFASFFIDKTEIMISRKFDYIITADDAVRDRFKEHNPNVDVIYNFADFQVKEECDIPKEYDCIYQGGITLERGALKVVQAIGILKEKYPNIKMIFVGPFDDPEGERLVNQYIEEKNLNENIIFTGRVPHVDVENYIRKSKVGIVTLLPLPKYFKNIPIKQFEYMSCGVPVVGSDLPPIKRFVESYNSGIIVDPTNPEAIADAIGRLLDNPKLCRELGNNGIRAVREAYNWGMMEKKLLKIYGQLE